MSDTAAAKSAATGGSPGQARLEFGPPVSIVTPLYNNAEHLNECLNSILNQSYRNWDCTIVDNCSTDGSLDVARSFVDRDSRFRIHRNASFLPAIANHNEALRQVAPEAVYCKIVFADDWIFPECLERMVRLAEDHPRVGIVGAYVLEGRKVSCTGLDYSQCVLTGRETCRRHLLEHLYIFGSANSLLYRADLVRSKTPFFDETNIHADTEVCFALLRRSDFGFVHQVLTFTRVREGSLTRHSEDIQSSYAGWLRILMEHGPAFLEPGELSEQLAGHLKAYYRFLGKCAIVPGGWSTVGYHRQKLQAAGLSFSARRVAWGAWLTLVAGATNPGDSWRKLRHRMNVGSSKTHEVPIDRR